MPETDIPNPKFRIDQTVWASKIEMVAERLKCPDCLDTREWEAHTPAGEVLKFRCPRCYSHSFGQVYRYVPIAQQLIIGSIRIDTEEECPVSYMCKETGIGTGNVYRENIDIFGSEVEAFAVAASRAVTENNELPMRQSIDRALAAASSTFTAQVNKTLEENERCYRWKLRDIQSIVFDDNVGDGELRERLRQELETVD